MAMPALRPKELFVLNSPERRPAGRSVNPRRWIPTLETLEDRMMPASAFHFAAIEGSLSAGQTSHRITLHPDDFALPQGKGVLKLTLEREAETPLALKVGAGPARLPAPWGGLASQFGPTLGKGVWSQAATLAVREGGSYTIQVAGSGSYRILVSLAGDLDADADVDSNDLGLLRAALANPQAAAFGQPANPADANGDGRLNRDDLRLATRNLGAATTLRPLELYLGLDPSAEPYAAQLESLDAIGTFEGLVTPGAAVTVRNGGAPQPVAVDGQGGFGFAVPLTQGENFIDAVAADRFGQRAEGGSFVSYVSQPSETPTLLAGNRDKIWLLDVHLNNYLFRGPLPLTDLSETGRIDYQTLFSVMNQRLESQQAPLAALPAEFNFIEVALITNRSTDSRSRGDEGFALHQIYSTILGVDQAWPPESTTDPTSLFSRPLDNAPAVGPTFTATVGAATHQVNPSVIWLPVAGNATGNSPSSTPDGDDGYETVLKSTFPIVSIAPSPTDPLAGLTNPLSNLSVATERLRSLMAIDNRAGVPNIYYVHCVNGHDRTGMISTSYVLAAYGGSFNYDLAQAYRYGMMGTFLPEDLPPGLPADTNFWAYLEGQKKNTGELKKPYMQAVRALAYLYRPAGAVQKAPDLAPTAPSTPLWNAGFAFNSTPMPTVATPGDYVHVRG